MLARTRLMKVSVLATAAVLSGGAAWAVSSGAGASPSVSGADEEVTTTTSADGSTTTSFDDGTTTTTSFDEGTTTTTTFDEGTTTTTTFDEGTTTTTTTAPDGSETCKPGHGYGDKNHCHSGPPGQNKSHDDKAGSKSHGKANHNAKHGHKKP
jgi:hypothetical protein